MRYVFLFSVLPAVDDHQLSPCVEKQRVYEGLIGAKGLSTCNRGICSCVQ